MDKRQALRNFPRGALGWLIILALQGLQSTPAKAQEIQIFVADSVSRAALPAVRVETRSRDRVYTVLTDSTGRFQIELSGAMVVTLSRFGYEMSEVDAGTLAAGDTILLIPRPAQLKALSIIGRNPYQILNPAVENMYARRAGAKRIGVKIYVVGDPEFEAHQTVKQLYDRHYRRPRGCGGPLWFLNGFFIRGNYLSDEYETVSLRMLEGVEIYQNPYLLPAEYWRAGAECGVIALWTRRG